MREVMRELNIKSFGPRLTQLLEKLSPHPVTGYFFHHPDGRPLRYESVARAFRAIRGKVGMGHVHLHDLRGTFIMHRAMVVKNFRQLQAEVGHGDAQSIPGISY
jgi:integrase